MQNTIDSLFTEDFSEESVNNVERQLSGPEEILANNLEFFCDFLMEQTKEVLPLSVLTDVDFLEIAKNLSQEGIICPLLINRFSQASISIFKAPDNVLKIRIDHPEQINFELVIPLIKVSIERCAKVAFPNYKIEFDSRSI